MLSLVCMVVFSVGSSQAQEKSTDECQLESVTVTAQKREENLQDVAISMDVFSGMQLEDANVSGFAELTRYSPNLFSTPNIDNKSIVIRGVSSINTVLSPAAGLFVNDISYPLNRMQNPDLIDVERIEILRGPQGTLYGKNTESGAINIVTKQPGNEVRGKVFGEYGFYDAPHGNVPIYRAGVSMGGPIQKDKLFVGVAFQVKESDGYVKNLFNGNEKTAETDHKNGQITLRWKPVEKWDISFISNIFENNDGYGQLRFENGIGESDFHEIDWNGGNNWKDENNGQVIRAKYSGDNFELLSITSRSDSRMEITNDADFGPRDFQNQDFVFDNTTLNQEIRFSSPDDGKKFKWVCGLFGSKEKTDAKSETPAYKAVRNTDIENESIAVFGQGTYTLYDRLHLTAGIRYEHQESEGKQHNQFAAVPYYSKSDSNDEFLPKASVSFDVTEEVMTYVTIAKGFLSGGYDFHMANGEDDLQYFPEYIKSYEAGVKATVFDNRLVLNLAVFHLDIEDKQIIQWPAGQSPMLRETSNAAEASSNGFELEIKARPVRGLDLFAGFGYTKSKFDEWVAERQSGGTYDYKDNYLPNVPRYTFNAGVQYRAPNGLFLRTDLLGTGKYYSDSENTQKVDGYETINMKIGFERENYDIVFWGKNVFDEEYVTSRVNYFDSLVHDGEPRSCGVTVTYRF